MNEEIEELKLINKVLTKNNKGLKETIDELRNKNVKLRDELEVKNVELNKEKETYNNLLEKYNKLVCCHLRYEEMTGVDLLLPDKIDVISKDKIKAKIKELEPYLGVIPADNKYTYKELISYGIEILQELLEEE